MMYEHLRNDLALKLCNQFNSQELNLICLALDEVAQNYEISEKCTQLTVYEGGIPKIVELYINSKLLEGLSPNSAKLYAGRLKIFFEIMQKRPEDINTNDIRCFLATYKKQRGISNRTLDKFRQIINGFYVWCVNEDYITKNPCMNIKEIKYEVKPRRALTRMELETLRRSCTSKRDLAIIDTLYSTGCRVSELVNMKKSDINVSDKSIDIVGKGNKHNTCYFNINAQLSLEDYIKERKDNSEYLFVRKRGADKLSIKSVEDMFAKLSIITGLRVTPHIIRHTSATLALQSGMPLTQVQKMLGHSSSDTTLIYAEILKEDIKNSHLKYVI